MFHDDSTLDVQKENGVVLLDGKEVARIERSGPECRLNGRQRLPELQWLAVVAVYADTCNAENMRHVIRGA